MKKSPSDSAGFSAVEGLLILVIVALVGFVGWYVWHSKNSSNKAYNGASNVNNTSTAATKKSATAIQQPTADTYAGWKEYCSTAENMCFKYPSDWSLQKVNSGINEGVIVSDPGKTVLVSYSPNFNTGEGYDIKAHTPVSIDQLNYSVDKLRVIQDVSSAQLDAGRGPQTTYLSKIYIISTDFISQYNFKVGETSKEVNYWGQYTKLKTVPGLTNISQFGVEGGPFGGPQPSYSSLSDAKQWFTKSAVSTAKKILLSAEYK